MVQTPSQNRVLPTSFRPSGNFFLSDRILRHYLQSRVSGAGKKYMEGHWQKLGRLAATEMDTLSLQADKQGPELVKRNFYGEDIDEIRFHPAYDQLMEMAVASEMFRVKWEPELRATFKEERHRLGFATNFLYALGEGGIPCPLCMTDGVARLLDRYATNEDRDRLLPHIYTDKLAEFYTGAMFLTEKAGGSDVGANLVRAEHDHEDWYRLYGEKWFCSNANAELIFALARTDPEVPGTRGLSLFLIEKEAPAGGRNPMNIIRLKDKLGVRSMASAEILLTGTWAKRVGAEGQGFKLMADMVNLSRLYNASAALSTMRRALIEAYQYLSHRRTFGKVALEHALIREKLHELGAMYTRNFYLTWRAIEALDAADNGDKEEAECLRLLTPMVKKATAQDCVYLIRECMELMGGIGYIEDGVMPKLLRDALVLPIWEGAGNIMTLDMLRAAGKSQGLLRLLSEIQAVISEHDGLDWMKPELEQMQKQFMQLNTVDRPVQEATAKPLFERLTHLYQWALLMRYRDEQSEAWINPSLAYLDAQRTQIPYQLRHPLSSEQIKALIAWDF